MRTYLNAVVEAPSSDGPLVRALESHAREDVDGDWARIGVCNACGEIYRVVETRGVAEFVSIYHVLIRQGLVSTVTPAPGSGWHLIVG